MKWLLSWVYTVYGQSKFVIERKDPPEARSTSRELCRIILFFLHTFRITYLFDYLAELFNYEVIQVLR